MTKRHAYTSNRDELTGLLEKQTFYDCCQVLIDTMAEDSSYVVVFFDIENFKLFNANYGYEQGDELLKEMANIINDIFGNQLAARFTGDHFVIFANSTQIVPFIKQVRKRVKLNQKYVNLEVKAGIYIVTDNKLEAKKCCDRARMACVSIKKRYDIEYCFYDNELDGLLLRKQSIIDGLDEAIEKHYIKVFYQPMVRTLTGKLCSWEALVRWNDPEKGMVFPNEFIPVLEEYRLITKVDQYVIEQAIINITNQLKEGKPVVPVSLNLSRIDFEVLDVVRFIDQTVEKYNCPKDLCSFEVTESVVTQNPEFIMSQVRKLRERGYEVWMDDFGSGYSSLNGLKSFEFDTVKIDMEFLRDFDETDNGKIVLKHIVSLIKNLGMHTLIEGVETKEQYEYMTKLGCEIVQGYMIGRPMPYNEAIENLVKLAIEFETPEERAFFNVIGKVDVLRQNPLQNVGKVLTRNPLPLAIGTVKDGVWKFVYVNHGFSHEVESFGVGDISIMEAMLNNSAAWERHVHFWELLENSKESHSQETMDVVERGRIINIKVRHIAEDKSGKMDAYLITLHTVSKLSTDDLDERMSLINRTVFSFYECIDLFGISSERYENLYLENSRLHLDDTYKSSKTIIEELANRQVHNDDRKRFLEFLDLDTAETRINAERNKKLSAIFRILDAKGNYRWKSVTIAIVKIENETYMLSCVSEVNRKIADNLNYEQIEVLDRVIYKPAPNDIIANVLNLIPIGIFWKDENRRFMGANKMFLEYYGFKSVNSILGKTDEDMGWHIDPEPFRSDELSVIHDGKVIQNVHGECIIKGEVRDILATKKPFIVDGNSIGLIGFFRDVTDEIVEKQNMERLSMTDELTGVYNRRGFNEFIARYEQQYHTQKTDFALFMLDVDKFKMINDMYGHEIGDVILKDVSKRLRVVASGNSLVFRFGGDEFIILHQLQSKSEVDEIKKDIALQMQELQKVEGVNIKVTLSVGVAIYSEVEDLNLLLDTADKRMYDNKSKKQ